MIRREYVISKIRGVFEKWGFDPIETPAFEDWSLLSAKQGGGDEIKKEIYYFNEDIGHLTIAQERFQKKFKIMPYIKNIDELMEVSDIIITKPRGITTAEALARALPMLIVSPLPGQEAMNTKYLLREGVALKAENTHDCALLLEELLYYNVDKLRSMSMNARRCSKPESSIEIARLIVGAIR